MSQRPVKTNAFVGGLILGLVVGGTALAFVLFVLFGVTVEKLATNDQALVFACEYVVAVLIGVAAMTIVRRSVGFGSGLLVGLAAGLLGGTAFCNVLVGGLNNMH